MLNATSRSLLLIVLAATLAACAGAPAEAPAAQPSATAIAAAQPSATLAPTAEPTSTPQVEPSAVPTQAFIAEPTEAPPTAEPTPAIAEGTLVLARGRVPQRLQAVMIDNHPAAYPQIGLNKAPLVFEALAEFGITRYMAVFAPGVSAEASAIGPVRSARAYFVEWAMGLDAVYAHAGGSPDGLELAQSAIEIVNADALSKAMGGYFRRDGSRRSPHNLFTDSAQLARITERFGDADTSEQGFLIKPEAAPDARPPHQRLRYFFLYPDETAGWDYDAATNSYARLRRDRPHLDGLTGKQLVFKDVVMLEVKEARRPGDAKGRIDQQVVGEGRARIFMDGVGRDAVWRKPAGYAPLRFYDAAGAEIALNAGPVWVAALPSLDNLTVEER
jgi:hypothetical protein